MESKTNRAPKPTTPAGPSAISEPCQRVVDRLGSPEHAEQAAARKVAEEAKAKAAKTEAIKGRLAALWRLRGRRYAECSLDNFQATTPAQKAALANVARYVECLPAMIRAGTGLVLFGPPGTGKDHLLAVVMRAAIEQGAAVEWRSGPRLFAGLRDRLDDAAGEGAWITSLTKPHVLAISDPVPPVGGLTNYQASMLYAVIDERYSACRPTWVTLNATGGADAAKRITEPILDRLKHGAVVVPCDWESYRKAYELTGPDRRME